MFGHQRTQSISIDLPRTSFSSTEIYTQLVAEPCSTCCLGVIAEKFDSPPYSEQIAVSKMVASIGGWPFSIKRTALIGWESFSPFKMTASIVAGYLQLKEQFWLAEQTAILDEPFASYLKCVMPWRWLRDKPWMQISNNKTAVELTLRHTWNAALVLAFGFLHFPSLHKYCLFSHWFFELHMASARKATILEAFNCKTLFCLRGVQLNTAQYTLSLENDTLPLLWLCYCSYQGHYWLLGGAA